MQLTLEQDYHFLLALSTKKVIALDSGLPPGGELSSDSPGSTSESLGFASLFLTHESKSELCV